MSVEHKEKANAIRLRLKTSGFVMSGYLTFDDLYKDLKSSVSTLLEYIDVLESEQFLNNETKNKE